MSKNNNLKDFLTDVADAIRAKKGTTEKINPQNFADEIASIQGGGSSMWTGHVDVEGLKAIGWTDEDIAYYQEHGVNWNEEDDEYHKVSDDNKALYGVLTVNNIKEYSDRIVYLPKIDTSEMKSFNALFSGCNYLKAIPRLDTTKGTNMQQMFYSCDVLDCIYPFDTSNMSSCSRMFYGCRSLKELPTSKIQSNNDFAYTFYNLSHIASLRIKELTLRGETLGLFMNCLNVVKFPDLDMQDVTSCRNIFLNCKSLRYIQIKYLPIDISLESSIYITKESMLYMIENSLADNSITITLHANAYARLANDPDIVAALENHPLVSLASA